MANASVLTENLADSGTITADVEEEAMPVSYLQVQHVEKRWRAVAAAATVLCDLGASSAIDTVALLGMTVGSTATVRIRISTADATGAAGDALDTGVLASGSQWFDATYGSVVYAGAAVVTGRYVRIDIAEAGAVMIEAGRLVVGARSTFTYNFTPGSSRGRNDLSRRKRTEGGQMLVERKRRPRTLSLDFDFVTAAQWQAIVEPIDRDIGLTDDILFVIDAESGNVPRDAVWGFVTDLTAVPYTAIPDIVTKQYRLEERL